MGLHDSLLNVPERLRVWQQAGVRYLFVAEEPEENVPLLRDDPLGADPAAWPEPWPGHLAKAPSRPRLVITYVELGLDLTGRADPRRGNLWRTLIRDLGLAGQGGVAFWPVAVPQGEDLIFAPAFFRAGLARLSPRLVAVFGDKAAAALFPDGGDTAAACDLDGTACVVLPDPETLLAGNREAWAHVLAILGRV